MLVREHLGRTYRDVVVAREGKAIRGRNKDDKEHSKAAHYLCHCAIVRVFLSVCLCVCVFISTSAYAHLYVMLC